MDMNHHLNEVPNFDFMAISPGDLAARIRPPMRSSWRCYRTSPRERRSFSDSPGGGVGGVGWGGWGGGGGVGGLADVGISSRCEWWRWQCWQWSSPQSRAGGNNQAGPIATNLPGAQTSSLMRKVSKKILVLLGFPCF